MEIRTNMVYNCDCLELMQEMVRQKIKVDCVITDPPYLVNYKTNRREEKGHKFSNTILNDNNPKLIKDYIRLCYDIMKDNTALYMFCNSNKIDFFKEEVEKYFTIKNIIIWVKNNWTAGDLEAQYGKQYEVIIYANKGRALFNSDIKRQSDVWVEDKIVGAKQIHQNQKPTNIIYKMLKNHTRVNDLVFDGFMGSFTTAVACHKMQRRFIGAELDSEYYASGSKRLKDIKEQISIFD